MVLKDYHVHTLFCDGKDSAEDMVLQAISMGMEEIGFSAHSHTPFDTGYCLKKNGEVEYREEIDRLRAKYFDKIRILCGMEMDYYSDPPAVPMDYIIGSVHFIEKDGKYLPIDNSEQELKDIVCEYYGGDYFSLAEDYYRTVSGVITKTGADIIGHFDLITVYNEGNRLFDTEDKRYIRAWEKAVDALVRTGVPFEINTGAISRGYRNDPYPSYDIMEYIRRKGGRFILSSDAHKKENLCFMFDRFEKYV